MELRIPRLSNVLALNDGVGCINYLNVPSSSLALDIKKKSAPTYRSFSKTAGSSTKMKPSMPPKCFTVRLHHGYSNISYNIMSYLTTHFTR